MSGTDWTYAEKRGSQLHLIAMVGPSGRQRVAAGKQADGVDPVQLGRDTAQKLLSRAQTRFWKMVYSQEIAAPAQP